jgi:hypothetical protein
MDGVIALLARTTLEAGTFDSIKVRAGDALKALRKLRKTSFFSSAPCATLHPDII